MYPPKPFGCAGEPVVCSRCYFEGWWLAGVAPQGVSQGMYSSCASVLQLASKCTIKNSTKRMARVKRKSVTCMANEASTSCDGAPAELEHSQGLLPPMPLNVLNRSDTCVVDEVDVLPAKSCTCCDALNLPLIVQGTGPCRVDDRIDHEENSFPANATLDQCNYCSIKSEGL